MTSGTDVAVPSIKRMEFDSDVLPFYPVEQIDKDRLPGTVEALAAVPGPLAIDATVVADDVTSSGLLMNLGFRKVCTQFTLTHPLSETPSPNGVVIDRPLLLDRSILWQRARNYRFDGFSLDPLLPAEGRQRLCSKWISNSMTLGKKLIVHLGDYFYSLLARPEDNIIDLVSFLRPRPAIGTKLVDTTVGYAQSRGLKPVHVTTECENKAAWNLYLKRRFRVSGFLSVFHFVRRAPV